MRSRCNGENDPFIMTYSPKSVAAKLGLMIPVRALAEFGNVCASGSMSVTRTSIEHGRPGWEYGIFYGLVGPLLIGYRSRSVMVPMTSQGYRVPSRSALLTTPRRPRSRRGGAGPYLAPNQLRSGWSRSVSRCRPMWSPVTRKLKCPLRTSNTAAGDGMIMGMRHDPHTCASSTTPRSAGSRRGSPSWFSTRRCRTGAGAEGTLAIDVMVPLFVPRLQEGRSGNPGGSCSGTIILSSGCWYRRGKAACTTAGASTPSPW